MSKIIDFFYKSSFFSWENTTSVAIKNNYNLFYQFEEYSFFQESNI